MAGIDDTHGQPGFHRVVQKNSMNGLPHCIVATERKAHVGNAARDMRVRQLFLYIGACVDVILAVKIVFFDAGRNSKDVRVKDDVFRRKPYDVNQKVIGTFADVLFSLQIIGLPILVESHDNDGGTVVQANIRLFNEWFFALL